MTIAFRDNDGTTRLAGDLLAVGGATGDVLTQQADGTYEPAAGGSQTGNEQFTSGGVNIADGASAPLTWTKNGGDTLVDLSVTTAPTIIDAGDYALSVSVSASGLTAAGWYRVVLDLDADGDDWQFSADIAAPASQVSVSGSASLPAGAAVKATITSHDGVAARDFFLAASLERVS